MTPFERALSAGGDLVAAWDFEDNARERLVLYKANEEGAHQQAETHVSRADHEDMVDSLVARGVRIGAMYAGTDFVWVVDEAGYAVWRSSLRSANGNSRSPDVVRVHVWLDPADRGHRGVRLELGAGEQQIAEERRPSAQFVTYGQDDLYYETFWAHYMSEHLALWHEVPVQNDISPQSNDTSLAVRRAALDLSEVLERDASERIVAIRPIDPALQLGLGMSRVNEMHEVEVRVKRASSGAWLTSVIKRGTATKVAAFLRRVTTPSTVLTAIHSVLQRQPRS